MRTVFEIEVEIDHLWLELILILNQVSTVHSKSECEDEYVGSFESELEFKIEVWSYKQKLNLILQA